MRSQRKSNAQNYLAKKSKYPLASEYLCSIFSRKYVRFFLLSGEFYDVLRQFFPMLWWKLSMPFPPRADFLLIGGEAQLVLWLVLNRDKIQGAALKWSAWERLALKQYFSFLLWQITRNSFDFPFLWTVIYYLLESRTENIFTTFPNTAVVVWVPIDFSCWKNGFQS